MLREDDGSLTSYENGDRLICIETTSLKYKERNFFLKKIAEFNISIIHYGRENTPCKPCNEIGHRIGDDKCQAKTETGTIMAFRGYQHP